MTVDLRDPSMFHQMYLLLAMLVGFLVVLGFVLTAVIALICKFVLCKELPPKMRRAALATPLVVAVVYGMAIQMLPGIGESMLNKIYPPAPTVTLHPEAKSLHQSLLIADWHADSLMWTHRNLLERSDIGHVDLPRLIEGNVAVQGFGSVTKVPLFMSFDSNTNHTDAISLVAFCQQWPFAALTSLAARAQLQAARLHDLASKSNGALRVIKYREDVVELLEKRRDNQKMVGGFLGIEGAHALDGDFSNVDRLYEYGFRVIGPSHFFDNELAGSAHGVERYGLTEFGKKCIRRMEELGIFVDLAHASQAVISDVLAMATRPVVVTHGGVQGFCNTSRTLSDDQLRAIAKTGGVVGIAYFEHCTCGQTVNEIALSIKYAIDLIGAKHVALGSDYDGSVVVPFDTTQLIQLTDALLKLNISKEDIRLVMGESTIQLLRDYLPSRIPGAVRV